jgi:uncharacterized protein YkwD
MDSHSFIGPEGDGWVAYLGGERLGWHEYLSEAQSHYVNSLWARNTMSPYACVRAREMTQSFSHTRPDGTPWWTVLPADRRIGTLEIAVWGADSLKEAIDLWESSPSHAAIMRYSVSEYGLCKADGLFVVQGRL